MIQTSKLADERREGGTCECWLLHGAVGHASDWRSVASQLAEQKIGSRAIDLWRFLDCCPMPLGDFARNLNAEVAGSASSARTKILVGYSMGGRLALHALLEDNHPWDAAILISAHPGLASEEERIARRARDADWASRALMDNWESFLNDWNAQAVLTGTDIHHKEARARLAQRRKEIARSFIDWSLGTQADLWPRLREIRIPVLWLAGEMDEPAASRARRAATSMPHATCHIAPQTGHRIPWQSEAWLLGEITSFISHPKS